jgi:hypothetical protein
MVDRDCRYECRNYKALNSITKDDIYAQDIFKCLEFEGVFKKTERRYATACINTFFRILDCAV